MTPPAGTARTPQIPDILVVGLGAPDRGDDGIGPAIAYAVEQWHAADVVVVTREDPTALVQLWDGYRAAIVIDAVVSGAEPGTVHVRRVGEGEEPLPTDAFGAAGRGGSHTFGVAGAVELARSLGTLPAHVTIVGVEAATLAHGPMSAPVLTSIREALAAVYAELDLVKGRAAPCA